MVNVALKRSSNRSLDKTEGKKKDIKETFKSVKQVNDAVKEIKKDLILN
jgi:hypothetical protein